MPPQRFPALYPILDSACIFPAGSPAPQERWARLRSLAAEVAAAGVSLLQYRNKTDSDVLVAQDALAIREAVPHVQLILNDRPVLAAAAGWDGVHVGQDDLPPAEVRALLGAKAMIGLSTHDSEQAEAADREPVDYIAVGPVFRTISKSDTSPVIGLEGVARARALTSKPLVAIGGITLENAPSVYDAGADSLAVISAVFGPDRKPGRAAEEFLRIL